MVRNEENLKENHQDGGTGEGNSFGHPQEDCRQEDSEHSRSRGIQSRKLNEQTGDNRGQCTDSAEHLEGANLRLVLRKIGRSSRHILRGARVNRNGGGSARTTYHWADLVVFAEIVRIIICHTSRDDDHLMISHQALASNTQCPQKRQKRARPRPGEAKRNPRFVPRTPSRRRGFLPH